ncbi:MAG: hypothetical protein FJ301_05145 [Planctomycetes bacterium]|nr:hypothetical protein [Planctomycetota bacterium]
MNATKIAGLAGVLLAVVGAFTTAVPYASAALVLIGLFVGWSIAAEDHVRVIVSALALTVLSAQLGDVPTVGGHLTTIFGGLTKMTAGAALMIIACNIHKRFKP